MFPPHIAEMFYRLFSESISLDDFAEWLYANESELKQQMNPDDYLDLISFNFEKSYATYDLLQLVKKYISCGEMEKRRLLSLLEDAKHINPKLSVALVTLYNLYSNGYYFLEEVEGYGLYVVVPYDRGVNSWCELEKPVQDEILHGFFPELSNKVERVISWLNDGTIVLTGEKDDRGYYSFLDFRKDKMKRILVILPNLDLGGLETVVMNFFRNFDRIVFDFVVHGEKGFYEDEAVALGAEIFRVPTRGESFFGNIFAMRKIYRGAQKYDTVIVCTEHAFAFIELAVAWFCGVKNRVAWSHFSDYQGASRLKRQANFLAQPFLRLFANKFLACTKDAAGWLFGKSFKEYHIISNAIDLDKFKFNAEIREKTRAKHDIGGKFAVGIIGRLTPVKNHGFALDVFRKFLRMTGNENAILLIIGDGELRENLEEGLAFSDFRSSVILTGKIDNTADYYQALDVLLVPSIHEGLPLVTIEAQAASLPVIISDGIPKEAKISEHACFIPLAKGADAWAEKLCEIKNSANKRAVIDLKNSGYHIEKEAKKLQEILYTKREE